MKRSMHSENFRPISVKDPTKHPALFRLRCIFDLQLATIFRNLNEEISKLVGEQVILDVGAGEQPWKPLALKHGTYLGLDIGTANEFGMAGQKDVVYYDGKVFPFESNKFTCVLCIEVLEHSSNPELLLSEMFRVMQCGGRLILTVPWSARRHHIPLDFHRFTRERLSEMLLSCGFSTIEIKERGSDISVIANKLEILNIRLMRPAVSFRWPFRLGLGLILLPITVVFLIAAHFAELIGGGASEDPLGYFVTALKN